MFRNPRASLARAAFPFKTFFDPRYRPPTPVLVKWSESEKWKVKSEKWKVKKVKVKWIHFWSVTFFYFQICWRGDVLGKKSIGVKKGRTIFLWVLNFGEVGEILENFQNHPLGESFWKIFSKVWFWKKFTRDFHVKNENCLERFSRKIEGEILIFY